MFISNYRKFLKYFGEGQRGKLCVFTVLSMFAGIMEFLGISLIYPFIILIIKPEAMINKAIYLKFQSITNIDDVMVNALILGLVIMFVFIVKNVYMVYFNFLQSKFTSSWRLSIVNKFMKYFLFASYQDNIKISQADKTYILKTLCSETVNVCASRVISLGVNLIIVLMIVFLILLKYPIAGVAALFFVMIGLNIQNKQFKSKLNKVKSAINDENKILNRVTYSNIENLKEVKILSAEKLFYDRYCEQSEKTSNLQIMVNFYNSIPPHLMEIFIVFTLIILGAIVGIENIHNQANIVASFALLVAAIFRIAPAMNRMQSAIINITTGETFVEALLNYYEKMDMDNLEKLTFDDVKTFDFNNKIELKNVSFSYDNKHTVLKNISLEINKGDFIGIIGLSGAGKTTLVDVLIGLLPIKDGKVIIDGVELNEINFPGFRKIIGYVPQDIRLLDASIKENVAWGELPENIDEQKVVRALKEAQLYDFVKTYKEGINLSLAQHGLSAGQRQRLAIARALYREPQLILLDEATSALDVQTEAEITDMLNNIRGSKTIISIAHRLSTLKLCNKLVYMNEGKIIDIGNFEELSARHKDFENLVNLSMINKDKDY